MIFQTVLVFLLFTFIKAEHPLEGSLKYLLDYGYINKNDNFEHKKVEHSAVYINALKTFQQNYNLPADGVLNSETLNLMKKPRRGVRDHYDYISANTPAPPPPPQQAPVPTSAPTLAPTLAPTSAPIAAPPASAPTSISPAKASHPTIYKAGPSVCEINKELKKFLIVNENFYIFHEDWVWRKNLSNNSMKYTPIRLSQWLTFLEHGEKIQALYQRPNGNILIYASGGNVYNMEYPSLRVLSKMRFNILNITAVVNTYQGRTYVFHADKYFTQLNECDLSSVDNGDIEKKFLGIPRGVEGAFRYTDGLIYFFKRGVFYAYGEFQNRIVKSGAFDVSIFNIECPTTHILKELKLLLLKLEQYYKG